MRWIKSGSFPGRFLALDKKLFWVEEGGGLVWGGLLAQREDRVFLEEHRENYLLDHFSY